MMKPLFLILLVLFFAMPASAFDANDLAGFCEDWLTAEPTYDHNTDGIVNFADWAYFAANWMPPQCPSLPSQAILIAPSNHATDLQLPQTLSWSVEDCNGESTLSDVWFGRHNNMAKVLTATDVNTYTPSLQRGFQYDWRVDTINNKGTTTGTTWTFNTADMAANTAPSANDVSYSAVLYQTGAITLNGTDDGFPFGVLFYQITSLPAYGYLQDPASQNPIILANQLPYMITSGSKSLNYLSDSLEPSSFTYRVYDAKLFSNPATVSITVTNTAPPYLSLSNSGYVVADSNSNQDLKSGWAIQTVFKTKACEGTIVSKRDATGKGWDITLQKGRLAFSCYDANGHGGKGITSARVNTGEWMYACIGTKSGNVPNSTLVVKCLTPNHDEVVVDDVEFDIPGIASTGRYACTAQLKFAGLDFDGSLARQRFFSGVNPHDGWNWDIMSTPSLYPYNSTSEAAVFDSYTSNLRWMMNDGTGSTVREDKANLNGSVVDGNSPYWHEAVRFYYKTGMDRTNGRTTVTDCDCNPVPRGRSGYRSGVLLKSQHIN